MGGPRRGMTIEEFMKFAAEGGIDVRVAAPHTIVPCRCGDVNCHGWRIVSAGETLADMFSEQFVEPGESE